MTLCRVFALKKGDYSPMLLPQNGRLFIRREDQIATLYLQGTTITYWDSLNSPPVFLASTPDGLYIQEWVQDPNSIWQVGDILPVSLILAAATEEEEHWVYEYAAHELPPFGNQKRAIVLTDGALVKLIDNDVFVLTDERSHVEVWRPHIIPPEPGTHNRQPQVEVKGQLMARYPAESVLWSLSEEALADYEAALPGFPVWKDQDDDGEITGDFHF